MSLQAKSATRRLQWKQTVAGAAQQALGGVYSPFEGPVSIGITYFHDGAAPDVDNIIKPIQDALCGLIIVDDAEVIRVQSARRDINGAFIVRKVSAALAAAFSSGDEFLNVRIDHWVEDGVLI